MKELTRLHKTKKADNAVTQNLQQVLTDTYGLYLTTHSYHWNVEGVGFVSLHNLFDEQYKELFRAIDVIAERIRALDSYVFPFEGEKIIKTLETMSDAITSETNTSTKERRMIHNLIEMNESVVESCQSAKEEAQDIADDESEHLMIERITTHQKALWMLQSIVK